MPTKLSPLQNSERYSVLRLPRKWWSAYGLVPGFLLTSILQGIGSPKPSESIRPSGLQGQITHSRVLNASRPSTIRLLSDEPASTDMDLAGMARAAMNYLIRNPRPELNYEPVFQIKPLAYPPAPVGHDPIVPGDTDCRMDWEFLYMRTMSGSREGLQVEKGLRQRILSYVGKEDLAWVPPGHYMEGEVYRGKQVRGDVASTWATAKIIVSLCETHTRTGDTKARDLARKMFLALRKLATWDRERAYFEGGSGAWKDGKWVRAQQPTAAVEPIVRYWETTGDGEALAFAKALAEGLIASPELMSRQPQAQIANTGEFKGHMHTTLHGVWGVAHLGVVAKEPRYVEWARRVYNFASRHGLGTGWVSAALWDEPVRLLSETCATSDLVSLAAWIARGGHPEYWDHVERYVRNYIRQNQFFITRQYEAMYREKNATKSPQEIEGGLKRMRDFEGGFIGGPAPNDWLNWMADDSSFGNGERLNIFGCCVPEGMRALYTAWSATSTPLAEGVFVNLSFNHQSPHARVISFLPDRGYLAVKAGKSDDFFVRPPSWTRRSDVLAFVNGEKTPLTWGGPGLAYVKFQRAKAGDELSITYPLVEFTQTLSIWPSRPDLKFKIRWRGNTAIGIDPKGRYLPIDTTWEKRARL
jgi:hypothetical protein